MTSISQLIPHAPPMVMLSEILEVNDESLHGIAHIGIDNPFVKNGCFACAGSIELFAQAAGALFTRRRLKSRQNLHSIRPSTLAGAVVQLKTFQLSELIIPIGSKLQTTAHFIGGTKQAGILQGEVNFNRQQVFKGTLMIAMFKENDHD